MESLNDPLMPKIHIASSRCIMTAYFSGGTHAPQTDAWFQETPNVAAYYLLKTEPSEYSFADLSREGETVWDGVSNPVALRNLRSMHRGDKLLIYETGNVKSVVGAASVISVRESDPKEPKVKIKAARPLAKAVPLSEIKTSELFADSPLVRQGRLSVVPLSEGQYRYITGK